MKREVVEALRRAAEIRRPILGDLTPEIRLHLLEELFIDFFVTQWQTLLKWGALTGQSAQVDAGYIAQHVASIVLGEPGQGFKGKGVDLMDGTEVKAAAIVSGVDRPRWNHQFGTPARDDERRAKGGLPGWEQYLLAPSAFYLLFDRVAENVRDDQKVYRVRAWCVDAQEDEAWRSLILEWVKARRPSTTNFQLHPPVGYDDSIVVNSLGNLDLEPVKVLEARIHGLGSKDQDVRVEWVRTPPVPARPVTGRSARVAYGGPKARPSRLNTAAEMLPDMSTIQDLLPGVDLAPILKAFSIQLEAQEELADSGPSAS